MVTVIASALLLSFAVYLFIGIRLGLKTRQLSDWLPMASGGQATVRDAGEFSASTVATTISLATVVVAFFELAPYFGVWLFWCVATTAAGIWVVRALAPRIWSRLSAFPQKPSLHAFLGQSFGSGTVAWVGAACTALGFLSAFALELTVGSRFLSNLIQGYPQWAVVAVLSAISFLYTGMGGFRAVIVTDRLQMAAIWLLLGALSVFTAYYLATHGGWSEAMARLPENVRGMDAPEGLGSFMAGILVINVLSYAADMSVWQRIAASESPDTVGGGLRRSVLSSAATWALLVGLACLGMAVMVPVPGENPLMTLLAHVGLEEGVGGKVVLFLAVLGLFGAMLSTASTQLIAVSHTVYADLASRFRKGAAQRASAKGELLFSRVLLAYAALLAVIAVEALTYFGFSVADLVFAVYGAQLALFPPIVLALMLPPDRLKRLSGAAAAAIVLGFCFGWGGELLGKALDSHLAFLSPILSVSTSGLVLGLGYFWTKGR